MGDWDCHIHNGVIADLCGVRVRTAKYPGFDRGNSGEQHFFTFSYHTILNHQPMSQHQFVTNVLFGKFILGTEITWLMYFGSAMTCAGVGIIVLSCQNIHSPSGGVPELLVLWRANLAWNAYLGLVVVVGGGLHALHRAYQRAADEGAPWPHSAYVLPVTFAVTSALFGTMSVVFAKILAIILFEGGAGAYAGPEAWFFYVCLLAWLAFVGVWLHRLNLALSLYPPIFIIPLLQ